MNLLDRAKKLLQGQASAPLNRAQHYHVTCPAGHRLSGTRNEGYQALRCPACGEGVFVLPRSPFAEIAQPARSPGTARPAEAPDPALDEPIGLTDPPPLTAANNPEDIAEIEWEETPVTKERAPEPSSPTRQGPSEPGPKKSSARPSATSGSKPKPNPARPTLPAVAEEESTLPASLAFKEWARRRRNPLVFTAVALIAAATLGLRTWRSQLQDYPRQAEIGRTLGLKALDEGRFDTAHQLLSEAKRAVDALGGKVEGAEDIRKGADEAALFANLVPESLETLIDQADAAETSSWPSQFAKLYKGRAYIFDSYVTVAPGENGAAGYDLDYRIFPNGEGKIRRVGRLDLKGFKLFQETQPKVGARLQFGGRLASFTYDSEHDEWLIGLEPDSGVILLHHKALETMGWPSEGPAAPEGRP